MDMYAHPSFLRGRPDALLQLCKITKSTRQRCVSDASSSSSSDAQPRSVSPSPPSPSSSRNGTPVKQGEIATDNLSLLNSLASSSPLFLTTVSKVKCHGFHDNWVSNGSPKRRHSDTTPARSTAVAYCNMSAKTSLQPQMNGSASCSSPDRGKLDLLAMALEREFAM
jgi:hypothetical protein